MSEKLITLLNGDLSNHTKLQIIDYLKLSDQKLNDAIHLFTEVTGKQQIVLSWALSDYGMMYPQKLTSHLYLFIDFLKDQSLNASIKRNLVRIFQYVELSEDIEGTLFDLCFMFLNDVKEPIAVRVFSMTVCSRIAMKYPELAPELRISIEEHYDHGSAGFKNRATKILKKLDN